MIFGSYPGDFLGPESYFFMHILRLYTAAVMFDQFRFIRLGEIWTDGPITVQGCKVNIKLYKRETTLLYSRDVLIKSYEHEHRLSKSLTKEPNNYKESS